MVLTMYRSYPKNFSPWTTKFCSLQRWWAIRQRYDKVQLEDLAQNWFEWRNRIHVSDFNSVGIRIWWWWLWPTERHWMKSAKEWPEKMYKLREWGVVYARIDAGHHPSDQWFWWPTRTLNMLICSLKNHAIPIISWNLIVTYFSGLGVKMNDSGGGDWKGGGVDHVEPGRTFFWSCFLPRTASLKTQSGEPLLLISCESPWGDSRHSYFSSW